MTDDDRSLDERASSLLDGESVDDDVDVRARAEEFRRIRDAVATTTPPSDDTVDRAVAAALASVTTAPAPHRTGAWRTRVLAAAATIAVVGGGVFAASQISTDGGDDMADGEASTAFELGADETADAVDDAETDAATRGLESAESTTDGDANASSFDGDAYLGEFESFVELENSLGARLDAATVDGVSGAVEPGRDASADATEEASLPPIESPASSTGLTCAPEGLDRIGIAIVDGVGVVVFVDPTGEFLVTTDVDCEPVPPSEMTAPTSSP